MYKEIIIRTNHISRYVFLFYVHNIISFYHGHLLLCGEACQDISYMKSVLLQWCSKSLLYYLDRKKHFKPKICRIKQVYNWIFMGKTFQFNVAKWARLLKIPKNILPTLFCNEYRIMIMSKINKSFIYVVLKSHLIKKSQRM